MNIHWLRALRSLQFHCAPVFTWLIIRLEHKRARARNYAYCAASIPWPLNGIIRVAKDTSNIHSHNKHNIKPKNKFHWTIDKMNTKTINKTWNAFLIELEHIDWLQTCDNVVHQQSLQSVQLMQLIPCTDQTTNRRYSSHCKHSLNSAASERRKKKQRTLHPYVQIYIESPMTLLEINASTATCWFQCWNVSANVRCSRLINHLILMLRGYRRF